MDSFSLCCYSLARRIPKGKVATYGGVARALHSRAYRAVGNAMRKNQDPSVPCHRVVCSDGRLGGYNRGAGLKKAILEREGITVKRGKIDLRSFGFELGIG